MRRTLIAAALISVALSGCLDPTSVLNASMTIIDGNEQTGTVNQPLPDSLTAFIVHNNGLPLEGITVRWSVENGGGSVSPTTSVTDMNGLASTSRTLGPTVGEQTTIARVDGIGSVRVTHTAVP